MNKIFSISKDVNHIIITILNIKIKLRFYNTNTNINQINELKLNTIHIENSLLDISKHPIYHFSALSMGNAGDNILVSALRKSISKNLNFKPEFISKSVREEPSDFNIYLANKSLGMIIGGGGLFLKDTNENKISGWQFPISIDLINKIKVPLFLISIGYNRFRGQDDFESYFTDNLNAIVEKASFVGIRNNGSIRSLRNYLRSDLKDKLEFHPCPTTILSKIYNIPIVETEDFIAIECAFDRENFRYGKNQDKILNDLANAIKELSKKYKIKYYVHRNDDNRFLQYLDKLNIIYDVVKFNGAITENDFLKLYSTPKLVIGMRGHAQLIPFGCNTPILSIISHDKLAWFLEDINHPEWGVDVVSKNFKEEILEKANYILSNKNLIKNQLIEAQDELYKITMKNLEKIAKIITEKEKNSNFF